MKPKSAEKLILMLDDFVNEQVDEQKGFMELRGTPPMTKREEDAFRAGIRRGWNGAINTAKLHNL